MPNLLKSILDPFKQAGRLSKGLLGVFLFINGLVLVNACLHNPAVGYDAGSHLNYIRTLATFHLPTPGDSDEFFSPPLPYVLPALLVAVGSASLGWAAKAAQLLNVVLSVGLSFSLLKICDIIAPGRLHLKVASLAFLGMLPVYYKTFALVRGEPFLAFLTVFLTYQMLAVPAHGQPRMAKVMVIGLTMGLMALSRQWAFTLFPAVLLFAGVWALKSGQWRRVLKLAIASFLIAFVVAGWFYLHLLVNYGTATAFNRERSQEFSLANQPASFYFGLGLPELFRQPIRGSFANQLPPIFYSETWGDYWGYFLLYGRDTRTDSWILAFDLEALSSQVPTPTWLETNRQEMAAYLGRVNLLSLLPTAIALAGLLWGVVKFGCFVCVRRPAGETAAVALFTLLIMASVAGYLWFLIMYPNIGKGDTIKASYQLHIFPFVAILAGELLERIRRASSKAYVAVVIGLALVSAHNLPAMVTHFGGMPLPK